MRDADCPRWQCPGCFEFFDAPTPEDREAHLDECDAVAWLRGLMS